MSHTLSRPLPLALLASCAALATPLAPAASLFEFSVWMRDIDQRSVSVQRHLARRDADAARADARRIAQLYGWMEAFYGEQDRPHEAAEISREGKELAAGIPAALDADDFDAAAAAALRIARACNDCHDDHKPVR
jgi:hypothetical protein